MERFNFLFAVGGLGMFFFAFCTLAASPWFFLSKYPTTTVTELVQEVPEEFAAMAEDYPKPFKEYFGEPTKESFTEAIQLGKKVYMREACWHCHSQFVRPISNESLRFGTVSTPLEYQNEMFKPQLFGTRRVGPDLIREAGKHSNDWHFAHFYEPRDVVPPSVMPAFPWFFKGKGTKDKAPDPTKEGMALVAYVQWLGSWARPSQETIYNIEKGAVK